MLYNIVTENCMAAMPIEILADAKANNKNNKHSEDQITTSGTNNNKLCASSPVAKTDKTNTILNWLKNTTTSNTTTTVTAKIYPKNNRDKSLLIINDNREIDSCNKVETISNQPELKINSNTERTCPSSTKQQNNTSLCKESTALSLQPTKNLCVAKEDETLKEFRGVQTLRNFWNKRISANRESALSVKGAKRQFTKSVSCLVNAISNTGEPPPPPSPSCSAAQRSEKDLLKARKLRALSLHDCSRDSLEFDEISLSDIDIQKHLEKDNFYKYKTAEQAFKLRELSERSANRKLSNGIVLSVGSKADRFDWLKRHDKFSRKKFAELTHCHTSDIRNNTNNSNQLMAAIPTTNTSDIVINEHEMPTQQLQYNTAFSPTAVGRNTTEVGNASHSSETLTPTLTTTNSPQHAVSRRRATTRKDSPKTLASVSTSISRESSTTSLATSANNHKTVVKRNSSARKYSFKTHTRSYHVPRKMHTNKDAISGGTGIAVSPSNSLVAKLTQQFNEIIQKDETFLEEIKRKNGVLMTHRGHVYKVVETASLHRNQTSTGSVYGSRTTDGNGTQAVSSNGPSTVQKNIRKFESELRGLKPKVPLKSIQVLRKSNELVIKKATTTARFHTNRLNNKTETDGKAEKPQSLPLPLTLEIVQEETKTPLESHSVESSSNAAAACTENHLAVGDICKQDEFLAALPPKIDSVVYKSIHKNKQKAVQIAELEESAETLKNIEGSLNGEGHIPKEGNQIKQQEYELETVVEKETEVKSSLENAENKLTEIDENTVDSNKENAAISHNVTPDSFGELKNDTKGIDIARENSSSPDSLEEDDKKKRKHKYAKIYEKLRLFTPFSHSSKKQKLTATSPNSTDDSKVELIQTAAHNVDLDKSEENTNNINALLCENPKLLKSGDYTPMNSSTPRKEIESADDAYSMMYNPEAKLLDALEQVDKKLQNLFHENDNILASDEYGQPLKPNSSFLHQTKDISASPKPSIVIQAVNVTLVNAIEGEQVILEQKEIQEERDIEHHENQMEQNEPLTDDTSLPSLSLKTSEMKEEEEEPFYELICIDKPIEIKTDELAEYNKTIDSTASFEESLAIEEDIYQTVEEAKNFYNHIDTIKKPDIVVNSLQDLDGYEPIENPDDLLLLTKSVTDSSPKSFKHYDGYEEYTPAVEIVSTAIATTGVRKVTDELPDLPTPKRILSKSPKPCRSAPKPPILRLHSSEEESLKTSCHESHYYGGDENIYDTIKGFHCYESLQSIGNKSENSPPLLRTKNSDCLSLSSNCYESISHYNKRTNAVSNHSGGSSNGSTLTISSENKTNSLYEDSLNASLHYSSKRICHMNTYTHIEINKSPTDVNSGYGGSIGHTTDTSDEWTDVTDNENGDVENKPQFIIVRERSKVHKSPDWSRRVRDKRQRKSKSCIEDDDPDHFYEQLSPLVLSKRHSLLEQTSTNSLQRNENCGRVSKRGKQMSYSAHALGQHISDDSFDSDTDDYYESENFKNAHNDSGVDIRNTKLPDPPTSSSNQMYSFVKKFKNFIVNKKSPNTSKNSGNQQKIYDSSSQFYATGQHEEKPQISPLSLQVPETKELSNSEKNLILAQSTEASQQPINASTEPRKSAKSGKSLRSRIRKSLVGFDNKQLSTLTPTRSTFYIEDPANEGQLDSGFSEKALSGELTTTTTPPIAESQKLTTVGRKAKKESKLNNSQRRRTTIGIRPHEPPPPPPPDNNTKPRRQSNTSWYAECGVFKNGTTNLISDDSHVTNSQHNISSGNSANGSTWYEEAGLYQTSGMSVASSSGSSGVSTSNEAGPADEMSHSMFNNEPLYQIYSAAKLEAISRDMQDGGSSSDGYEEIGDRLKNGHAAEVTRKSLRPSALQLVEPKSGPERTLWSQIPEVINSYILPTMTPRERALMEAKFEIITSEASYLKSLNLLRTHYMNHPIFRDQNIVSSRDRKSLFAHIVPVHECSEKLLSELESCWQDNIMLIGLSKRIYAVAEKYFHVYVGFCEHQGRMDRTLKHLREGKGLFAQNLELLESSPACCGLNLHSFLMLPMQRITRLPLLIDAVFSKCHINDDEYENWKMCLAIMNKIVTHCNEAANKSEQAYEIERISRQLEFNPSVIRPLAIAPAGVLAPGTKPRYLVKKGELTHLVWRGDDAKLTFGKKFSKTAIYAFLFSDLLVLTKRKAEEQFSVFDYCPRNMLTITPGDSLPQLPTKDLNSQTSKNLILMTLLENHERKTVELLLSCPSVSEQERWLQAMRPPESETPGEKLYEQWDCPQVIAKHAYENNEPDALNLDVGDVVNVTRKLPDGWYKGERIRDGAVGWFPGSYTEEVNSVHVRARNLKQRHRLLTFTATYLESQKRNK